MSRKCRIPSRLCAAISTPDRVINSPPIVGKIGLRQRIFDVLSVVTPKFVITIHYGLDDLPQERQWPHRFVAIDVVEPAPAHLNPVAKGRVTWCAMLAKEGHEPGTVVPFPERVDPFTNVAIGE